MTTSWGAAMNKPRVCYIDIARPLQIGRGATVFTVNHYKPQLTGWIRTSKVLSISGAEFETLNTIYYQAESDESDPYSQEKPFEQASPHYDFAVDWRSFVGTAAADHYAR